MTHVYAVKQGMGVEPIPDGDTTRKIPFFFFIIAERAREFVVCELRFNSVGLSMLV